MHDDPTRGEPVDASAASGSNGGTADDVRAAPDRPAAPGMALGAFLRGIRAHPLVIIAVIGAALAGSAFFVLRDRTYEATAEVLVTPLPAADRSLIVLPLPRVVAEPERAVNTAAALIESPAAARLAAERLGPPATKDSVTNAVTVSPDEESFVVSVAAESKNPEQAARIANEYARAALDVRLDGLRPLVDEALERARDELANLPADSFGPAELLRTRIADLEALRGGRDPTLSLAEEAPVPLYPAGPSRPLVLGLALIGGLVIGLAAAILIELLVARRLDADADLKEAYPLPILARIPVQTGGPPPARAPAPALTDGYRALRVQLDTRRSTDGRVAGRGTTVLVSSGARDEGRTTTALGLARAIAGARQTVLLLDFDLEHPSVNELLELAPALDLADVLLGQATLTDAVTPVDLHPGLSIVAAPRGADAALADRLSAAGPAVLREARSMADWVIIDAPPVTEAPEILSMASEWDQVLLITWLGRTDAAALAGARELLESLELAATGHVTIGPDRVGWRDSQNGSGDLSRRADVRRAEPR